MRFNVSMTNDKGIKANDVELNRSDNDTIPTHKAGFAWSRFEKYDVVLNIAKRYAKFTTDHCSSFIDIYLSSASFIHRSSTGLIFCALFGVISNFSNLCRT